MATSARDLSNQQFRFYVDDAPRQPVVSSKFGTFHDVVQIDPKLKKAERQAFFRMGPVNVVDGRSHLPGGKEAWKFDTHGFCYIKTPEYEFEEHQSQNRRRVNTEFGPKVAEACRVACGAKKAFWMSHQRRAEKKVGTIVEGYATALPHSDYGPDNEAQIRGMLEHRYGLPHEEAQSCGTVLVNMWCPVERPAYQFPLCLLDSSSVDMEKDTLRYLLDESVDNGYGYYNNKDNSKSLTQKGEVSTVQADRGPRPLAERVPQAAVDAPACVPLWRPHHRYVFLPDMQEDEAAIFKQYDYRKNQPAKATFHCAVDDQFHKAWKECPARRSIECRVILVYDPEEPSSSKL